MIAWLRRRAAARVEAERAESDAVDAWLELIHTSAPLRQGQRRVRV